jgi:release factor glutamine methyltransferase
MSEVWTTRRVLDWTTKDFAARGLPSARLDAELLAAHALGTTRVRLYLDLDRPLLPEELVAIRELVGRRRKREPVAYVLGHRDFYGRSFIVSEAVLVPRPDTEVVVEATLKRMAEDRPLRVLDLCTGSGCIGLTIAAERKNVHVDLVDLSPAALAIAQRNVEALHLSDRARLFEGDLYAPVASEPPYDVIISNPPYIESEIIATLEPEVRSEPRMALDGGMDGLDFYRRLCAGLEASLLPDGIVAFEVGAGQASAVEGLLRAVGMTNVVVRKDYGDIERVVIGTR